MDYIRGKFMSTIKYVVLAVDIPKNNEQNLAAVEQIYVNLTAIKGGANWIEKYFKGKGPLSISLELVSHDGFIQFLIRTPERFKDLVSSSIYSQYPEAEIVKVDDYVNEIPDNIGDSECPYQLWGTEFVLEKPSAFPLKTYKMFEHSLTDSFNDPLTPLLEAYSRLSAGESAALQIIITPLGDGWKKEGANEVKKLFGAVIVNETKLDKHLKSFLGVIETMGGSFFSAFGLNLTAPIKVEQKLKTMNDLTPGERNVLEKIQEKLSLPSFSVTMRYYYLAKREVYNRNRGVDSVKGAMSQFGQSNLNGLTMHATSRTDVDYYFVEQRVRPRIKRLARYFKARSRGGATEFFLSTEELATLFHFPDIEVKTPMLPKSMIKKSQPPSILPTILEENFVPKNITTTNLPVAEQGSDSVATIKREDIYNIINSLPGYDFVGQRYESKAPQENNDQEKTVAEPAKVLTESVIQVNQIEEVKSKYEAPENLPFIQN